MIKYKHIYAGLVHDAMTFDIKYEKPFVLPNQIKKGWDFKGNIFGKVFNVKGKKVKRTNDSIRMNIFNNMTKDSIFVLEANDNNVSHFGDITGKILKRNDCRGAIIDGYSRDIEFIKEDKLKIYCKGYLPQDSYGTWQMDKFNVTLEIGNVIIEPNDYIYADDTAILLIPEKIVNELFIFINKRFKREEILRKQVANKKISLSELKKRLGRW